MGCRIAQDSVHNTASFDTGKDMCNEDTETRNHPMLGVLCRTACVLSGLVLRLVRQAMLRCKPLETCLFQEDTARRKPLTFLITHAFVVHASSKGLTPRAHQTFFQINQKIMFPRLVFFFPRSFSGAPWDLVGAGYDVPCQQ